MSNRGFDYNLVFNQLTPEEVDEANIALDIALEAERQAIKRK